MSTNNQSTIVDLLFRRVENDADRTALGVKRGGKFQWLTWRQVEADVRRFTAAMLEIGVGPRHHVAILSENRYEWVLADLATQIIGAVTVPLHATLAAEQIASHLHHGECRFVLCSDDTQVKKLARCHDAVGHSFHCLSFEPVERRIGTQRPVPVERVMPDCVDDAAWQHIIGISTEISCDRLATILYTSGTSGQPKGVMLSQGNLAANALGTFPATGEHSDDVKLGFLPLSHIFARTCDLFIWIACGNRLALAESRETVLTDCQQIRPTWINGVPYFFEMVRRHLARQETAKETETLRNAFGGQIRSCQCGGAAISRSTYDYYWNRGVPIYPGYGLTEASPVISVSAPGKVKQGCVGTAIRGVDVRISSDGEILTRGPHVMLGYWRDAAATASTIVDRWLRTGDLGDLDHDGLLRITGRRRELIVTTGGKNIVPTLLESLLEEDPLIQQAMVVGDGRDFLSAFIVPDHDLLRHAMGSAYRDVSDTELVGRAAVQAIIEDCLHRRLACVSRHEQIGKFALLDRPFTIESGELTPKRSLRRAVIEARNAGLIEAFYDRPDAAISNHADEAGPTCE